MTAATALALNNKQILLGVTGGIAAYKSAEIVRRLQELGASVRVIMTDGACEFITPLTLQALSGHPVHRQLLDEQAEAGMGHIELARWADLLLIAPATADCIAELVQGSAGNLLTAVALATPAKVAVAPAMNQQMWAHPASQQNIDTLAARGVEVLGPEAGIQACGDVGLGRLLTPEAIANGCAALFSGGALQGQRVVITAGPTREPLDPVRYISNHSSGKMGYALAEAALEAGASVTLISGPVSLSVPAGVARVNVESALQMHAAALEHGAGCDLFIAAAAVADYRPVSCAEQKIKKQGDTISLELTKNPDIVASVTALAAPPRVTVGFAAETEQVEEHARGKLAAKRLTAVVANNVARSDIGFNSDDNEVTLYSRDDSIHFDKRGKAQLARDLVAQFAELLKAPSAQ